MNELLAKSTIRVRIGLGFAAMAMVLLELLLTRVFSASAGYHFAFMIISMTMFGLTAGALYAFARPPKDDVALHQKLVTSATLFSGSIPVAYFIHNYVNDAIGRIGPFWWIAATFVLYSVVFFFAGTCISLCLTRFREVGKLYCADLIGASIGCPLLILGLAYSDPQAIVAMAGLLAGLAAMCFIHRGDHTVAAGAFARISVAIALCIASVFAPGHYGLMSALFGPIEYVKWSPCGRVACSTYDQAVVTWSKVFTVPPSLKVPQKGLFIDFGAFTVMTGGNATPQELEPIKHDITAVGNRLRPDSSLFVIGVGGGRDVLTGLLFGQKRIDGIEVNPAIVSMISERYADFNGHLTQRPGVRIINDEARNWLARSNTKYDVIQCSLVDTWAASSSGAFMLTENVLYTKEAFNLYMRHLEPTGVLSFLRWGDEKESAQLLRMVFLAKNALKSIGIDDVSSHIMLISGPYRSSEVNIGNILVSPTAFSKKDIDALVDIAKTERYKLLWVPGVASVEPFANAITSNATDPGMPSDDRPFFFTPVQPSSTESSLAEPAQGKGLALLFFTLMQAAVLVIIVILFPCIKVMGGKIGSAKQIFKSGLMFSALGVAFMLIEVAQVQRLTILLGNPTYGLSVVLFALLMSAGIGSYVSQLLLDRFGNTKTLLVISLLSSAAIVALTAWLFASWLPSLESVQLTERMVAAVSLVSVPGFFMGWAFPLSLTLFTKDAANAGSWYWAVNGATSVLSSVLASIISIVWGIETTLLCGAACYLVAICSLL